MWPSLTNSIRSSGFPVNCLFLPGWATRAIAGHEHGGDKNGGASANSKLSTERHPCHSQDKAGAHTALTRCSTNASGDRLLGWGLEHHRFSSGALHWFSPGIGARNPLITQTRQSRAQPSQPGTASCRPRIISRFSKTARAGRWSSQHQDRWVQARDGMTGLKNVGQIDLSCRAFPGPNIRSSTAISKPTNATFSASPSSNRAACRSG